MGRRFVEEEDTENRMHISSKAVVPIKQLWSAL
jgi:hypothetical protein